MKRKVLVMLLMFSMLLGSRKVAALTTAPSSINNIIPNTSVPYGYHYTLKDWNGNTLESSTTGFEADIDGDGEKENVGTGMLKYYSTDDQLLFCAELGTLYGKNVTSTSSTTYTGRGPVCGILRSMAKVDTTYEIGQKKGDEYTRLGIDSPVVITPEDVRNYSNNASYIKLQRAIWKYQSYTDTCKDVNGEAFDTYVVREELKNTTIILPTSATMKLSSDGKYYEATLTPKIENEASLVNNIKYVEESDIVEVTSSGNNQIKIKVDVADFKNEMKFELKALGTYNDYINRSYTPSVTVYDMGAVQDVATVSMVESSKTVTAPLSNTATITLTTPEGSIEIIKNNSVNSTAVKGAKFKLYVKKDNKYEDAIYLNGTKVGELTTDEKGKILIRNLPYGSYLIEESGAAPGYIYDEKIHFAKEIVINATTFNHTGVKAIKVTNEPIKIMISKKDVAKEGEVEGAKIAIYKYDESIKEKGEIIVEFTSAREPFEYYLEPGIYALEETLAPASYQKLETTFVFKVEANADVKLLDTYSDKNIVTENNTITLYNEVIVVPDTRSSINPIYIVIGSILVLAGSGLIYFTVKRRIAQRI